MNGCMSPVCLRGVNDPVHLTLTIDNGAGNTLCFSALLSRLLLTLVSQARQAMCSTDGSICGKQLALSNRKGLACGLL